MIKSADWLWRLGGQAEMDRDDLVDRAWGAVEPILALEDSELEFVDRLQTGDLRLDLLFPEGSEWLDLMNKWPPLKWKELNARKFKSSD